MNDAARSRCILVTRIFTLVVFLCALPIMSRLIGLPLNAVIWNSDHPAHVNMAAALAADWHNCLPHPLYHMTLVALSAGNKITLPGIAATVLAMMIALKANWVLRILRPDFGEVPAVSNEGRSLWPALALASLLIVAMPLPNWWKSGVLLGQPSPNVWHNPTTIFCMPIALILFSTAVRSINSLSLSGCMVTGGLLVVCTLAKPNFPLAFAPCCALMLILRGIQLRQWCRMLACGIAVALPFVLLIACQFMLAFGSTQPDAAGIEMAPLKVWSLFTPNITASTVLGLGFPLAVAMAYPRRLSNDSHLIWAWLTLAIAMLQMILFAETGFRWMHGNFTWGMLFATAIVYAYSARLLLAAPRDARQILCAALLLLHAISGIVILVRALLDPGNVTLF